MQNEAEPKYADLKAFFSFYSERYLKVEDMPPDKRPIESLEALEKKSMKAASRGLRQAINDCVAMSIHFDQKEVEQLDLQLRKQGIVTLSELRRRYSKAYAKVVERGQIRNEMEYNLVRNVLDDPSLREPQTRALLERMISVYEGNA